MSEARFAYYYKSSENLKKISEASRENKHLIDSLNSINKHIDSVSNAEIDGLVEQKTILMDNYEDCNDLKLDLELEVLHLRDDTVRLKNHRMILTIFSILTAVILAVK